MYTHTCTYMNMYICIHKLCVDMLTSLLSQNDKTPPELSDKEEVKTVFAQHFEKVVITNENQNWLLLICARLGLVSRVRALLQAGAKAAHTDEVRVCEGCVLRTLMYMHACKHAFVKKCAYADRVRAQERLCIDTLTPLTPCCRPSDPPAHACMISQIHTHTHVQDGKTALWLACENQHEAAAMELVEPTKDVGALNKQVGGRKGGGGQGRREG